MQRYNPKDIEPKWQKIWDETGVYTTDLGSSRPKYIGMSMFNYPSGAGIHIGHAMNYTISDVKARFKRQQGFESYHPVGWDAFGLPAENYAIKTGVSPQESMAAIIPSYHKQYKAMGWSNDWEKEIATHLPEYYEWSQWIFAEMYRRGLVYQDSRMQWWCPIDNTVLANEQVIDGKCWRHDGPNDPPVERKEIRQWFFKITDYADELLEATDDLDWTESVKLAQKNWIGKSKGAEIDFKLEESDAKIKVFTTRPDTIFGATFLVLAPEHELVRQITSKTQKAEVDKYVKAAMAKSEVERQESKQKTGVFTGAYAINPANGERIPIWIADYVLTGYGTGAIMAVPAHDERDNEFAEKFNLPITAVVAPSFGEFAPQAIARPVVVAVLRDPKTDKYCVLKWDDTAPSKDPGSEFPGGGVEPDESLEQAVKREVAEETGYDDIKLTKLLANKVRVNYTAHDGQKKYALKSIYLAELVSDSNVGLDGAESYEKDHYEVTWMSQAELNRIGLLPNMEQVKDLAFVADVYSGEGMMFNSGKYDRLASAEAREKIVADLAKQGVAEEKTNYRMRDWSVSRQRYWGAPIPIINCPKCGPVLVPDGDLPVVLPELTDFKPSGDGRSALARATDWLKVDCPKCHGPAERETDTLDTYVDSSFYMLRYFDPHNQEKIFDAKVANKWAPIDFYNGGDHATAHMLYARFVTRFLHKIGLVDNPEPFKQFLFNGKVTAHDGTMFSKSKGNGVDPLEIINQGYGADALRTYLMFAAPLELWIRWDPQGVPGAYRFLNRLWNLVQEFLEAKEQGSDDEPLKATHKMIKKVTEDIEGNHYNTAIAAMMECVNDLYRLRPVSKNGAWQQALESLVACVAPFAPFIADELWQQLGHSSSVHRDSWPKWEEKYLASDTVTVAVQVNGKLRGTVEIPAGSDQALAVESAKAAPAIKGYLDGGEILKTIYVPDKLINFVVKNS